MLKSVDLQKAKGNLAGDDKKGEDEKHKVHQDRGVRK